MSKLASSIIFILGILGCRAVSDISCGGTSSVHPQISVLSIVGADIETVGNGEGGGLARESRE